jgi:hypothetical protein
VLNVGGNRSLVARTSLRGWAIRGSKSSLVIGQKTEIGPNFFPPRIHVNLVVWILLIKKRYGLTWFELVELGALKMAGQSLDSTPMSKKKINK